MTVPGTAEDRDVHLSGAQVAIVICVFLHGLDHDCVCVTAVLLFYSVGRLNKADSYRCGIELGTMLTLDPRVFESVRECEIFVIICNTGK